MIVCRVSVPFWQLNASVPGGIQSYHTGYCSQWTHWNKEDRILRNNGNRTLERSLRFVVCPPMRYFPRLGSTKPLALKMVLPTPGRPNERNRLVLRQRQRGSLGNWSLIRCRRVRKMHIVQVIVVPPLVSGSYSIASGLSKNWWCL
jgi:hypothetical protein